jgi:hypothetical protein
MSLSLSLPPLLSMSLSLSLSLSHQPIQPITVSSMKLDSLSSTCYLCQDHQKHISNHMLNITNTCLYQACTKHVSQPSTNLYHASTYTYTINKCINHEENLYHHMYQNKCINHSPIVDISSTIVPYHVPTMHINHKHLYHTMCQPCTSTINTCTIPCSNHAHKPYQYHQDMPQALCQHQVSNMHLNHVPNQEQSYSSTRIIPITSSNIQHSNHVPQTNVISLMIFLDQLFYYLRKRLPSINRWISFA